MDHGDFIIGIGSSFSMEIFDGTVFLDAAYFIVGIAVMAFVNGLLALGIRYFHPADQAC